MQSNSASSRCPVGARAGVWLTAALVLSAASPVRAQEADVEPDFNVQRFYPAPGPRNFLTTRGARVDGEMAYSLGLLASYGFEPFAVQSCITDAGESCSESGARRVTDVKVVENLLTADLMGSLTPIPILQLGLRLPVTWVKGQGLGSDGLSDPDGLSAVGLSDPELEAKLRAVGESDAPFVLGVAAFVTAPLGNLIAEDKYLGDGTPTAGGRVILDLAQGPLLAALNVGGALRGSSSIGAAKVGSELRYSAAAGFQVSPVFRVMADVFGSTRFSSESGENVMEALGAVQIQPVDLPVVFTAGAGGGVMDGIGVPTVRAMVGAMYAFERKDQDDDGLDDKDDQCPTEPEDRDGYQDGDGCPDGDNDLDAIADSSDKCPNQAEDMDGFEDTDGCPDLDNDKDGLPDVADQCPNEPETKNNYKDEDGCPDEADTDNDGVPDDRDQCPQDAEDTDGFQDTDGCPDPDNDNDGVPDAQDECIDEPETVNAFEDEDGCPDEPPPGFKPPKR